MADTPNLADTLYKEITAVIGCDNPNQYFCMGLPGTLIDPAQYTYDVDHNEPKPAHVKANESKLVNKLYREYVSAKRKWAEMQLNKKQELANKYLQNTEEDYIKRNNEFLEWYGIVAESEELIVEEKLGEVLSVFSPGDMEIITGILESGGALFL